MNVAGIIEKDFDLFTIILHEQPNEGNTIIEKLERISELPGYVFVLLTPDDIGAENTQSLDIANASIADLNFNFKCRARQNVILELGYFLGKLGRRRVCCLYTGNIDIPSDILGVLYLQFKTSVTECYREIKRELITAGFRIK